MIEVIHASALDTPDDLITAVDVMITDPPYSEHVHASAMSTNAGGDTCAPRDLGFSPVSHSLRDFVASVAARVSRWSVVFSDLESTHLWRDAMVRAGAEYVRETDWFASFGEPHVERWARWSQPQISGDRPPQGAEAVLQFHATRKGEPIKKRWNGHGGLTAFGERAMRSQYKHPTEKPLDLMLSIVASFSDPGELVFDPFAGAGTTAQACRLLDRDCLTIEKDEHWATAARGRVRSALSDRDIARAREWCDVWEATARSVSPPTGKHDVRTFERAQRRLVDVELVRGKL